MPSILDRLEYTGCTVNFRTYKNRTRRKVPKADKADWVILRNTRTDYRQRDGISFRDYARMLGADSLGEANPLTGKVICGECGSVMYNHRRKNGRIRVYYTPKGERRERALANQKIVILVPKMLSVVKNIRKFARATLSELPPSEKFFECIRRTCAYVKTGDQGTVPIVGSGTGGSRPSGYWKFCVCCK